MRVLSEQTLYLTPWAVDRPIVCMTILIAALVLVPPIYRCYHRAGVLHRVVSVPRDYHGALSHQPWSAANTSHSEQRSRIQRQNRLSQPSSWPAMTADCWALSFSDWWYLVTRRWIMSNLVSFTPTIDSKISALLWQHWRFRIKLLCVTQNIEHIYRAPASDYILLEFCSFPTEHMIIITVLLHCYFEFIIVS